MPSTDSFLKAFNLNKGEEYNGYLLKDILIHEQIISRYRHYSYIVTLKFDKININSTQKNLFSWIEKALLSVTKNVKAIKNYYTCTATLTNYQINIIIILI